MEPMAGGEAGGSVGVGPLGLAPLLVQAIFEIVGELRDGGQTILLVEQNARQALSVSSHAYVMENGKIVLEGPAGHLMSDPAIISTYLGQALAAPASVA